MTGNRVCFWYGDEHVVDVVVGQFPPYREGQIISVEGDIFTIKEIKHSVSSQPVVIFSMFVTLGVADE